MDTLITFLGRVPKTQTGYRTTRYRFDDGYNTDATAFFGWGLGERLKPERIVILGTAGSMWDYLVESVELGSAGEDERLLLQEATEHKTVSQDLLKPLESLLSQAKDCDIKLAIIPYGQDRVEQVALLQTMARYVEAGDRVNIDVTHGFRHLPMLALLSAMHLRVVREAIIEDIYYGAFDPDTGLAQVFELSGLLDIADWLEALHTFDKDSDYGVFASLLAPSLGQNAALLQEAAFFERTSRPQDARGKLREFRRHLNEIPAQAVASLFTDTLHKRTAWVEEQNYYRRQAALARNYLASGDHLRAVIMGFEAFITRQVLQNPKLRDSQNHDNRDLAKKNYERCIRNSPDHCNDPENKAYLRLRDLRNALAHGDRARFAEAQSALGSSAQLTAVLGELFGILLPSA